ncbi:hypothetical protein TVAG_311660 [Trichomonas vaginalis G3]|uniref:Uncharacterized protein n=1 Tax=Trichomonas vaginalis (strain ATCC PRA-98 / G3) TaxID=412133 RepID=A2EJX3_TRIV3|nr:hypothetical protein TVAGG3_0324960 [Trichomonas vaginalis G3]EAY07041.1 hypothetical protein TVAG_311660 [Trichomonas vaginalis G3]KAI5529563.1 hypothetical protein TVAGG3_0324960 [Trichomonas vaginalis G3]|eukprot:XP_001319264.1 hypothetical protein [Trichomonas vaginalis G3]
MSRPNSAIRIRSSINTNREKKNLPGLTRRCLSSTGNKTSKEDIDDMKLQIAKMELETRQIKSKTVRMNQEIRDRKSAMSKALNSKTENKTVVVATESTIQQLRENVIALENTLYNTNKEYEQLRVKDSLLQSQELQEELKVYYLEHQRLLQQKEAVNTGEKIITIELNKLRDQIEQYQRDQKAIDAAQDSIESLIDKLEAYQKTETKVFKFDLDKKLREAPSNAQAHEQALRANISELKKSIVAEAQRLRNIEARDTENMDELQGIIESQIMQIVEAVQRLDNENNEEEEFRE